MRDGYEWVGTILPDGSFVPAETMSKWLANIERETDELDGYENAEE